MSEIDIQGFEGSYTINTEGEVYSFAKYRRDGRIVHAGKRLAGPVNSAGYRQYRLHAREHIIVIQGHVLVARHFIPNPENKPWVNHINGVRSDNRVENLEWSTPSENLQHAYDNNLKLSPSGDANGRSKLKEADVMVIRKSTLSNAELAKLYRVGEQTVRNARKGRSWKALNKYPQ
jgi:hypothetical protein